MSPRSRRPGNYISIAVLASILSGGALAQPPCRVAFEDPEFVFAAGCLVESGGRMLVVRHLHGGRLGVPAGRAEQGESAQCVAHRETWEETGLDVVVHGQLKRFRNGFTLYRCELTDAAVAEASETPVPATGKNEVAEILWLDPASTRASDWRFPRDYTIILQLFNEQSGGQ